MRITAKAWWRDIIPAKCRTIARHCQVVLHNRKDPVGFAAMSLAGGAAGERKAPLVAR